MVSVALIFSAEYAEALTTLPVHSKRDCMTFSLLQHLGMLSHLSVIAPEPASIEDLVKFHSIEYIHALEQGLNLDIEKQNEYGLLDDAYIFDNVLKYCQYVVGASLTAAKLIAMNQIDVAINWGGGRHHAKKEKASGFCYVNDIVLSVLLLLEQVPKCKILVIDIDIHHGDGVEEAFYFSSHVCTLSFHKYARGFFPGTGSPSSIGQGSGRYRNLNVPLDDGITDEQFYEVFEILVSELVDVFQPNFIVLTCGVDTLSSDPLGTFNLTSNGIIWCMEFLKELAYPLLIFGGGGYHEADAARCFVAATATLIDQPVPFHIPDHPYYPLYGPHFTTCIHPLKSRVNRNTVKSLEEICHQALVQIGHLKSVK